MSNSTCTESQNISFPVVDSRSTEQILQQAVILAQRYCPDWLNIHQEQLNQEDPGYVLLQLFAQLSHIVSLRINQLPEKHQLSFYQFMGINSLPPKPAQALLSFDLDSKQKTPVVIPSGTQVASAKDQKVVLETTTSLMASPFQMTALYAVDPENDSYVDLSEIAIECQQEFTILGSNTTPVDGSGPVPVPLRHKIAMYSELFEFSFAATLKVMITFDHVSNIKSDIENRNTYSKDVFQWSCFNDKGEALALSPAIDWQNNTLTLTFEQILLNQGTFGDSSNNWLVCSLDNNQFSQHKMLQPRNVVGGQTNGPLGPQNPIIVEISSMTADLSASQVPWDGLFYNDSQVSATKGFYPFGKNPTSNDMFYFGNQQAFKSKFDVTLNLNINPGVKSDSLAIVWQYFDGSQWQSLPDFTQVRYQNLEEESPTWEELPTTPTFNFDLPGVKEAQLQISFTCPDIPLAKINQIESRWIRIRITDGSYGDRFNLTPLDLEEQQELQNDLTSEYQKFSSEWQDNVIPDESDFNLAELMKLGGIKFIGGDALSSLLGKSIGFNPFGVVSKFVGDLVGNLLGSGVSSIIQYNSPVKVKPRSEILDLSGLDQADPSMNNNMLKLVEDEGSWENISKYLSGNEWVIGSKKNCEPPFINAFSVDYQREQFTFDSVYQENNFETLMVPEYPLLPFFPFYQVAGNPCAFIGFKDDIQPYRWNAYFSLLVPNPSKTRQDGQMYRVGYQYYSEKYWKSLPLEVDQTDNLTRSGMIGWTMPDEQDSQSDPVIAARSITLFDETAPLLWTKLTRIVTSSKLTLDLLARSITNSTETDATEKLVSSDGKSDPDTPPTTTPTLQGVQIKGLYPNSVWTEEYSTQHNQILGSSNGGANQTFQITPDLVYPGQIIEVREETMPPPEQLQILEVESGKDAVRVTTVQGAQEIWVCWSPVTSLQLSDAQSRHYMIDPYTGTITFGDGVRGMIPPKLKNNIQAAWYQKGNINAQMPAANEITKMVSSLQSVSSVNNYEAAIGQQRQESTQDYLARTPDTLKTHDRAVTLEDFAFLATQSSVLVHKAKSYQNERMPHLIEVIVVPSKEYGSFYPGADLVQKVTEFLQAKALPTLANRIIIQAPEYTKIDVSAKLVISSDYTENAVKNAVIAELQQFLDPIIGDTDGNGWPFGAVIFASQVSAVILSVPGVTEILNHSGVASVAEVSNAVPPINQNADQHQQDISSTSIPIQIPTTSGNFSQVKLPSLALPMPNDITITFPKQVNIT